MAEVHIVHIILNSGSRKFENHDYKKGQIDIWIFVIVRAAWLLKGERVQILKIKNVRILHW